MGDIVTPAGVDAVVPVAREDHVVAGTGEDQVVATEAADHVVAARPDEQVGFVVTDDGDDISIEQP